MLKIGMVVTALWLTLTLNAQHALHGSVNNAKNEPLVGATVKLIYNGMIVLTDAVGNFTISTSLDKPQEIEVRFVGYKTKRILLEPDHHTIIVLSESNTITDEVLIVATRAADDSPTTFANISKATIQKQNFGQDLPFILNWSPSIVTTSDAGAGVGYTGMRIRGSDATRINVTINGIPLNDSESQGVFWVNTPDLSSSTQSIQVQRGVGTSTNGAAAFGASVNIQTNVKNEKPYADLIHSLGSFNTWRHTVAVGTGLINDRFSIDARLSQISSSGFIDRSSSDLKSYYLAGGYYGNKTLIKAIVFGGSEITYQSWYGVPQSRLKNDDVGMLKTAAMEEWNEQQTQHLLSSNSRTFNAYTYPNQVDNYRQDHYQLHFSHQVNAWTTANAALHYTKGSGYYEEYRYNDKYIDYGLTQYSIGTETFSSSDLVRRRWLDNNFYGLTWSLSYDRGLVASTIGGGYNGYDGDHFGEIIWSALPMAVGKDYRYYFNNGRKTDFNIFWKTNYRVTEKLIVFIDLQYRRIDYQARGRENKQFDFEIDADFDFFNPKMGLTYAINPQQQLYTSFAVANREPVRNDFVDGATTRTPIHETLSNLEVGWRKRASFYSLNTNFFLMHYRNQLVLTGALNDVGAAVRTNTPDSYRMGIELDGTISMGKRWSGNANIALSKNKIAKFTEVMYDYGKDFDQNIEVRNPYTNTNISFSPSLIAGSIVNYLIADGLELSWLSKYVGTQFLDNTSNTSRQLDAYFVNDLRLSYTLKPKFMRELSFSLLVNNVLDVSYESNGYTYGFLAGVANEYRQNFYYPQAGRNYLAMVALRF